MMINGCPAQPTNERPRPFLARFTVLFCGNRGLAGSGAPVATVSRGPDYHSVDRAAAVR